MDCAEEGCWHGKGRISVEEGRTAMSGARGDGLSPESGVSDQVAERVAEGIQETFLEIVGEGTGRSRPPGAVDEFIERWITREDVARILAAWAK